MVFLPGQRRIFADIKIPVHLFQAVYRIVQLLEAGGNGLPDLKINLLNLLVGFLYLPGQSRLSLLRRSLVFIGDIDHLQGH